MVHLTLPASNLERSARFYKNILGMKETHRTRKMVFLRTGRDVLVLVKLRQPHELKNTEVHQAFEVSPRDLDRAKTEFQKKKIKIVRESARNQGQFTGRSIYFLDPDRNTLEINEGGKKISPPKLSAANKEEEQR